MVGPQSNEAFCEVLGLCFLLQLKILQRFVLFFCSLANCSHTCQPCRPFFMDPVQICPDPQSGIEPQECRAKAPPPSFDKDIGPLAAGACRKSHEFQESIGALSALPSVSGWRITLGKSMQASGGTPPEYLANVWMRQPAWPWLHD